MWTVAVRVAVHARRLARTFSPTRTSCSADVNNGNLIAWNEVAISRYAKRDRQRIMNEIKLLRTAPSAEFEAYNAHAEACRAWGREQKAALGL